MENICHIYINIKVDLTKKNYQRQRGTLYNDERAIQSKGHSNPNICMHQTTKLQNVKQKLTNLKGERQIQFIVRNFNTSNSTIYRTTRKKISKDIEELNNTIDQQDLIDIHRIFHPTAAKCTFFSSPYERYENRPNPGP